MLSTTTTNDATNSGTTNTTADPSNNTNVLT